VILASRLLETGPADKASSCTPILRFYFPQPRYHESKINATQNFITCTPLLQTSSHPSACGNGSQTNQGDGLQPQDANELNSLGLMHHVHRGKSSPQRTVCVPIMRRCACVSPHVPAYYEFRSRIDEHPACSDSMISIRCWSQSARSSLSMSL
jgi:hypothetical protein